MKESRIAALEPVESSRDVPIGSEGQLLPSLTSGHTANSFHPFHQLPLTLLCGLVWNLIRLYPRR